MSPKTGEAEWQRHRSEAVEKTKEERPREHPVVAWSLDGGVASSRRRGLGGATTSGGEFADVVEEDRALEGVELRGVGRDLGEEGVRHEDGGLVAMAGVGVAQQGRDVDLECPGETIQGGQGRHGFAVLDLGDVGARHVHPGG